MRASSSSIGPSDTTDHASWLVSPNNRWRTRTGGVFAATTDEEEDSGRIGRTQQFLEQGGAVGVAPLQVVNGHDQWLPSRDQAEQVAQGAKAPLAQHVRFRKRLVLAPRRRDDRVNLAQDRKQPQQR